MVGFFSPKLSLKNKTNKKKPYFSFKRTFLLDARSKEKLSSWLTGITVSPSTLAATLFFCHIGITGNMSHNVLVRLRYKLITCIPSKSSH